MSHNIAVEIASLWKLYWIQRTGHSPPTATPVAQEGVAQTPEDAAVSDGRAFWALRDINLTINRGEAVGLIGRNGAGKSTLLKVLSRITAPTRGHVRIWGSIASLLEVGTGFHDELTGRENISLNGTILGMSAKEIDRQFDSIVEFSGIGEFLDTPVKHLSSGMRMRLGFSVAVHIQPDILVVDEVLAVGDAEFQERCRERVAAIVEARERTVFVVSHSMSNIDNLCERAIWMDHGTIVADGPAETTIQQYLSDVRSPSPVAKKTPKAIAGSQAIAADPELAKASTHATPAEERSPPPALSSTVAAVAPDFVQAVGSEKEAGTEPAPSLKPKPEHLPTAPIADEGNLWHLAERVDRSGNGRLRFHTLALRNSTGERVKAIGAGESVIIELDYRATEDAVGRRPCSVNVAVRNDIGLPVFWANSRIIVGDELVLGREGRLVCSIPELPLLPGHYDIDVWCLVDYVSSDKLRRAAVLSVTPTAFYPTGLFPKSTNGNLLLRYQWKAC